MTDLFADGILLLIQCALLLLRDVATVLAGHSVFFLAYLVIFMAQLFCLRLADFTALYFLVYTFVLICQAMVHFGATRMIFLPFGSGKCVAGPVSYTHLTLPTTPYV